MNILDEDKNNFIDAGALYNECLVKINHRVHGYKTYVVDCMGRACLNCIGAKHNIRNGCPVCHEMYLNEIEDNVTECLSCGSVIISCGCGDVMAVGIPENISGPKEDII